MSKFSAMMKTAICLWLPLAPLVLSAQASRPGELDDLAVRRQRVEQRAQTMRQHKAHAVEIARRNGFPVRRQVGDTIYELVRITNNKIYEFKTLNDRAAISAAVTPLFQSPSNLDAAGLTIGLWDGGSVRATHSDLVGRVTSFTTKSLSGHATHVAGTLIASGVDPKAKGMAPAARIDSYDFSDDLSEMTARAMSTPGQPGMLQISNHSYGFVAGWEDSSPPKWYGTWSASGPNFESDTFGQYDYHTAELDDLCYSAPYYLPFKAAGNDRSDTAPAAGDEFEYSRFGNWYPEVYDPSVHPRNDGWDNGGYDTIPSDGVAKNIITIGAVNDAVSGGQRSLTAANMASFSGWGPTDDGRIKPDIVANGVGLYSSYIGYDYDHNTLSGTSMAAPNACGAAALILQHYSRCFPGQYMRASTLKTLILHTADDLGSPGPDYRFGFGLINAKAAVDLVSDASDWPAYDILVEESLSAASPVDSFAIDYAGDGPIKVTCGWTDPAGTVRTGLDNPARALVNDLDIRLVAPDGTTTWMPCILDPANPAQPAGTGDNIRDNIEHILLPSPPQTGLYTLRVGFKGYLSGSVQHYSLAITGQSTIPQPPTAFDIAIQTPMDAPVTIELDALDDGFPKSPGRLCYVIQTLPGHGLLSDPGASAITEVPYTLADYGSQVFFTPRPGCNAPASFTWSADDGGSWPEGGSSNQATVVITFLRGSGMPDLSALPGDIEPDCDIDADDLQHMIDLWLRSISNDPSELTGDGLVNLEDLTILARYWLTEP